MICPMRGEECRRTLACDDDFCQRQYLAARPSFPDMPDVDAGPRDCSAADVLADMIPDGPQEPYSICPETRVECTLNCSDKGWRRCRAHVSSADRAEAEAEALERMHGVWPDRVAQ